MAEKQETEGSNDDFEWNVDNEIHLFMAMCDTKPAGINKHFFMIEIVERFSTLVGKEVSTSVIWKHLDTLYDMKMCDEIEGIPFPNEVKDFSLPEAEFGLLMKMKVKGAPVAGVAEEIEAERAVSPKLSSTPRSTSRGAVSKEGMTPKVSKKDQLSEKPPKKEADTSSPSIRPSTPALDTSYSKSSEKDSGKSDPRRDSKDSNASSKESGSVKGGATSSSSNRGSSKETKGPKSKRDSITGSDKGDEVSKSSEDSGSSKRGTKRPLRGSLKPEEQPTPPGRRRRI